MPLRNISHTADNSIPRLRTCNEYLIRTLKNNLTVIVEGKRKEIDIFLPPVT